MGLSKRYPLAWAQIMIQVFCPPLGALLIFCLKPQQIEAIPLGLAFAGGVLIWVGLLGLHVEALEAFTAGIEGNYQTHFEDRYAWLPRFALLCSMIAGWLGGYIIDKLAHSIGGHGHSHSHDKKKSIEEQLDNPNNNNLTIKVNLNDPERIYTNELESPQNSAFESENNNDNNDNNNTNEDENENENVSENVNENDTNETEVTEVNNNNDNNENNSIEMGNTTNIDSTNDDNQTNANNNPTKSKSKQELFRVQTGLTKKQHKDLQHASVVNFMAIVLHNLPEGLSVFTATVADPKLGALVAVAFALHEIPFGISVATPVYFTTGSKLKAVWWAFLCGCSMVIGGGAANIILALGGSLHNNTSGFIFGFVTGLMLYVAFTELIPQARRMDVDNKYATPLIFIGFLLMDIVFIIFDHSGGHSHGEEEDSHAGHNHRRRLSFLSRFL